MQAAAIVVAAGRGLRAGGGVPKQYRPLAGMPVLARTLRALAGHPGIADLVAVIHPDDAARFEALREGLGPEVAARLAWVHGGADRGASVRAGLAALPERAARVLIHDAARPLVGGAVIDRVLAALAAGAPGAAPGLAVTDALWRGAKGRVAGAMPRDGLWRAQTPQGFDRAAIAAAHEAVEAAPRAGLHAPPHGAADDVEVARAHGLDVAIVEGDEDNIKLTQPGDFARAERILAARGEAMAIRTGTGFDVHRFTEGEAVILCGIRIPHTHALLGHSDADVGMHALTDAIYGALADGDIGRHFPPSDPQWKGAASDVFLRHAVGRATARGLAVAHVDLTLICERPKIGPHAEAMRARLAAIIGVGRDAVGLKATTSEGLGFTGRGEGIAAMATATLTGAAGLSPCA